MEALGQTVAWAIASKKTISPYVLIGLNFVGLFIACVAAVPVVLGLEETDDEGAGALQVGDGGKNDSPEGSIRRGETQT